MPVLIIVLAVALFPPHELKEFIKHSNGMAAYELVTSQPCETGLRSSGYAYAPSGGVMLKQKNLDGTVDAVICSD